ncbi:MAG: Lrp/AsnC family transcriptional regulator [Flavobacteriaceae bacterium]|nr:Lrp/AsnC family transcriptional regulator [Flavobacteriaceae bacterium]
MQEALDHIDLKILCLLQEDAKMSIKDMCEILHLTKTPVYERIKRLEQEGYIQGYTVVLDTKKIRKSISVYCFISLEAQKGRHMDAFLEEVKSYKEIVECSVVGGDFDFLLKVIVEDLEAYYAFAKNKLASIPAVGLVKSAFVLDAYKEAHKFPLL